MKKKKLVACLLAVTMLVGATTALTACGGGGDAHTYEVWISSSEDPQFYSTYDDNCAVKYWNSLKFEGENGKETNVNFTFVSAAIGTASTEFDKLIGTGDYFDIMDMAQGSYTAAQLYEDGIVLDLTPYIEEQNCMPNYLKYLEENPTYAKTAKTIVNGEEKYLQIYAYSDDINGWGGFQYRRDWLAKYAKNPSTGAAFTGGFTDGVWSDNVMFPSWYNEDLKAAYLKIDPTWDGTVPVFISDWEFMLEAFATAIKTESRSTGYPMSIYYPGYIETGDLVCAFGGGGQAWYIDGQTIKYGGTSDNFKTYLECMNKWYENGWLDKQFEERKDIYYAVDTVNITNGNVGLFYSDESTTLNKLSKVNGSYVLSARQPINDKYGSGEKGGAKFVPGINEFTPMCFYQNTKESNSIVLTDKMKGKDIVACLHAIDHLYEREGGSRLVYAGLTKEQYDTIAQKGDMYDKYGIAEKGSYVVLDTPSDEGYKYRFTDAIGTNDTLKNASSLNRFVGLRDINCDMWRNDEYRMIHKEWNIYEAKGQILTSFRNQLDSAAADLYNDNLSSIRNKSNLEIWKFIKGEADLNSSAWSDFVKAINRYNVNNITTNFQNLYNQFYN